MKLECAHADTCLPDYWSGHHLPHVQIPVYHGMTLKAIKESLRFELAQGAIAGSSEDARLLAGHSVEAWEEMRAHNLDKAARAAINRMRPNVKGTRRFFLDLEKEDPDNDCWDSVYAFFVFVEM